MTRAVRMVVTVGVVGVFAVMAIATADDSPAATGGGGPSTTAPPEPPVDITIGKLQKEYTADEAGANARYKGKTLIVTGKVYSTLAGGGSPMIGLATGPSGPPAMAHMLGSEDSAVAKLKDWTTVKVTCTADDFFMGAPNLKECTLGEVVKAQAGGGGGGGSAAANYMDCLCRKQVIHPRLAGCRGNENNIECATRQCGHWDSDLHGQALRTGRCKSFPQYQ